MLLPLLLAATLNAPAIHWQTWNENLFKEARTHHKFVLLDLEAVWCHWCHVMDENTYRDPKVVALMNKRYIAVKVDQDSRPDISNRYEDYGWPATVVFNADGGEIVKHSGYLTPNEMTSMLQAIIDDPSPGPSVFADAKPKFTGDALLSPALRAQLATIHRNTYDFKQGGWGASHKYLDVYSVEYALARSRSGDSESRHMARQTLDGERNLLDPVWGGVYQYSTGGVWSEPHFEKIMSMQAGNLRIAALAYAQWHEPRDLATAQSIHRYLVQFLRAPDGAFYTSQNADLINGHHSADYFALGDAARRAKGIPRIDKHRYARENGWAAEALATLAITAGDKSALIEARASMEWVYAHLRRPDGGFLHGAEPETNAGGPYLGDTIAVARAELALYAATHEGIWLDRAKEAAAFIDKTFRVQPGYRTAPPAPMMPPKLQRDENIDVARFAKELHGMTADARHLSMATNAMRYLAAPEIAKPWPVGGVLLADLEWGGRGAPPGYRPHSGPAALFPGAMGGARPPPLHVAARSANVRPCAVRSSCSPFYSSPATLRSRSTRPTPGSRSPSNTPACRSSTSTPSPKTNRRSSPAI
jgi:uncharacterized protein YyaL (SSP411 family)